MNLKLDQIRRDDSAQPRAMLNTDHIKDLSDALEDGGDLTTVDVFYDGFSYWLADGFHRYSAYHRAKRDEIPVTVHEGDLRAAVLWSITANAKHAALKLTREEKRASVTRLLKDEEWGQWSDSEIGRRAGVDHKTVAKVRSDLGIPKSDTRQGADGRTINTAKIGKPKADPPAPPVESARVEPPAAISEPAPSRHQKTYSPPLTPDTPEEDDPPEEVDETESLQPYRPPYVKPADFQPRQFTDSTPVSFFEVVYLAVNKLRSIQEHKIVVALNSEQNRIPVEGALQDEMRDLIAKLERCIASAELEQATVTL